MPPQLTRGGDSVGYRTAEVRQLYHEERNRSYARKTECPNLDVYDHVPRDELSTWEDFESRRRHGTLIRENGYLDRELNTWIDLDD